MLSALHAEGWDLELPEVEAPRCSGPHGKTPTFRGLDAKAVIRVWNLNAYDNALAPVACKVRQRDGPKTSRWKLM